MFPGPCLREEGVEAVVSSPDGLVARHLSIRLDAVLQAVELPAGVADLAAGLADVDGDTLALKITKYVLKNPRTITLPAADSAFSRFWRNNGRE